MGAFVRTIQQFRDYHELEEFQHRLDLTQQPTRITQLERGRPLIRNTRLALEGAQLDRFEMSHKVKFEAPLLQGESVLVFKQSPSMHATWNGLPFPAWGVALMRGGHSYEIVHESGFASIEVTFSENLLSDLGLIDADANPLQLALSAREGRFYARYLGALIGAAGIEGVNLSAPATRHRVLTLCASLLDRLDASTEPEVPWKQARARVTRAERLIEERLQDPPTLPELSNAAAVSPRTLRREFLKVLGTTPQAYLLARRLEAAKQALRKGSRTTVADVSDRYGFSHPSRFTEHYKRQFGECPSAVIRSAGA